MAREAQGLGTRRAANVSEEPKLVAFCGAAMAFPVYIEHLVGCLSLCTNAISDKRAPMKTGNALMAALEKTL
jgi:hypothetical protein